MWYITNKLNKITGSITDMSGNSIFNNSNTIKFNNYKFYL